MDRYWAVYFTKNVQIGNDTEPVLVRDAVTFPTEYASDMWMKEVNHSGDLFVMCRIGFLSEEDRRVAITNYRAGNKEY